MKFHYMSKITGELCTNIFDVVESVCWVLKNKFPVKGIPFTTYIKYIFMWSYSKQGF